MDGYTVRYGVDTEVADGIWVRLFTSTPEEREHDIQRALDYFPENRARVVVVTEMAAAYYAPRTKS
jgi:hypothetical protein